MNMDKDLVNRALLNVGQYVLSDADRDNNNTTFAICKQFYIETFLEALSEVDWTGGRKRARLIRTGRPIRENNEYTFAYDLPFDCARAIELQGNEPFRLEDRIIFTNVENAELLYISNGKILRLVSVVSCPAPGRLPEMEYLTGGNPGDDSDVTLRAGTPDDVLFRLTYWTEESAPESWPPEWPEPPALPFQGFPEEEYMTPELWKQYWELYYQNNPDLPPVPLPEMTWDDDFPDYIALQYEPKFYQYVEMNLSAKLATKLSNDLNLSNNMLQKAMLIKNEAYDTSKSQRASQQNGVAWWGDELGFGSPAMDSRGNLVTRGR
jgi:hypothetical protein